MDIDTVVNRESRQQRRNRVAAATVAALMVGAIAVVAPSALGGLSGGTGQAPPIQAGGDPTSAPSSAPPSSAAPPSTPSTVPPGEAAGQVIVENFGVPLDKPGEPIAHGTYRGIKVEVSFTIMAGTPIDGPPVACTGESGDYKDVVCRDYGQTRGRTVSLRGASSTGAGGKYFMEAIYKRGDIDILLMVTYDTVKANTPRYPDNVFVKAVTDPRLRLIPIDR